MAERMTTHNTGNPVGSVDVRDLYDNAENLDVGTNSTALTWADRLGVSRKSWAGMEAEFDADQTLREEHWEEFLAGAGYQILGPYAAGLQFTSMNQTFSYLGEFYAPGPSIVFPYTTTGVGATEIANFRPVGDAILRQDLAISADPAKGVALVGGAARVVATIAELRTLIKTSASKDAIATGYYAAGDGGGGVYYLDSADVTSADNGGTIIVAVDGGRWKLAESGLVSARQFGAKGNGSTNDNAAIAAAVAALNEGTIKTLYFPAGRYVVNTTFTITANGVSIVGDGARTSTLVQTTNVDTLIFTSPTPSSMDTNLGRISDITMRDIGVDYGSITAPTGGRALVLVRPTRSRFSNIHIPNVYRGIDISGGGGDIFFSNLTIAGAYSWSGVAAGSFLLQFTKYANGVNEVPSEFFFDNFNIKGSTTPNYLQNGIIIQCGDGIWFSNGHVGFTDSYDLWLNAQNDAAAPISDIKFVNVYFDGNFGGSTAGAGIAINGSDTAYMEQITFIGCVSKIHNGHGVNISRGVVGLVFDSCQITYNGAYGVILDGSSAFFHDGLIFKGNLISQNNSNNSGADAFTCSFVTGSQISGNIVKGIVAKPHPFGFNIGANVSNTNVVENITKNCTVDYAQLTAPSGMTLARNRKSNTEPTIVCADGMVLPAGFDVITVTGNTNCSNIGGPLIQNKIVTLRFTGTPTLFDNAGNIKLVSNFIATPDSTLTLMYTASGLTEVGRAVV